MKKIFLVLNHAVNDYEDCGIGTIAYEKEEDAKELFKAHVMEEKKSIENLDWVISSDTDDLFEAYEEGNYSRNHTFCSIRELVIE
jgi:hypothetical protein